VSDLVKVPFHGDSLDAVRDPDGIWLSIPQACANLGLVEQGQLRKLQGKVWARVEMKSTPDARGHNQQTWCLHLDCVAMWLATIETSRVAESLRPKLERYQIECARVLNEHFFGKPAAAPDPRKLEGAGDLRDNRTLAGECKRMLARCALVEGTSFQKVHGQMRKEFALVSYLRTRLSVYLLVREWLVVRLTVAPVSPALLAAALPRQSLLFEDVDTGPPTRARNGNRAVVH